MIIDVISFSYKKGLPVPLNEHGGGYIFDCRSITNPGRESNYKTLTGRNCEVATFIEMQEESHAFYSHIRELIFATVERYQQRNFTYLSIAFGCTGGQHRSVYFAEKIANELRLRQDLSVNLTHRELGIYESNDSCGRSR